MRADVMTELQRNQLACALSSLCVFRALLEKKPMKTLLCVLHGTDNLCAQMRHYGEFVFSLADADYSFSAFLRRAVCEDENYFIRHIAQGKALPASVERNVQAELALFTKLTELSAADLIDQTSAGYLPGFENTPTDFVQLYHERIANIGRLGYGIFATAGMFKVSDNTIIPVEAADQATLDGFVGYAEERQRILDNTRALVEGRPAANALLCGDAGTGKSSTVKACANYFYDQGVRLIELRKDQLFSLSYVMGRIADNPLKFIIFIDDLSFNKNDDCFSMLKAALEGSATAKAKNAVIYATSNRRHIVKESFSDRGDADDVHHSDTVQELMSLSDRFGLTVYFSRPNKALYLDIVHALAERNGLKLDRAELDVRAEAFALARGSRSPRAAEQFIMSLM